GDPHRRPERPGMRPCGEGPDQSAALLGAQRLIERVGDQAIAKQAHLPGPDPAGVVLVLLLAHPGCLSLLPACLAQTDRDSPSGYRPAAQSELVLRPAAPATSRSGPV